MDDQFPNDEADRVAEDDDAWLDAVLSTADRQLHDYVDAQVAAVRPAHHEPPAPSAASDPGLADALTCTLNRAVELGCDLRMALSRGGASAEFGHSSSLARILLADVLLARDFEPAEASAADLDFALDAPAAPDRLDAARAVGRSRHLDFARAMARSLARDLADHDDQTRELVDELLRVLDIARDLVLGQAIMCRIPGVASINASGADLSRLLRQTTAVPAGTIWSVQTKWPVGMGLGLLSFSDAIIRGPFFGAMMML